MKNKALKCKENVKIKPHLNHMMHNHNPLSPHY
nr:MAG TPA: hypothetical protein [Caudoviricetes sp.]